MRQKIPSLLLVLALLLLSDGQGLGGPAQRKSHLLTMRLECQNLYARHRGGSAFNPQR